MNLFPVHILILFSSLLLIHHKNNPLIATVTIFVSTTCSSSSDLFTYESLPKESSYSKLDFHFEKDLYYSSHSHQSIILSINNRENFSNPFDITYQFLSRSPVQLDQSTGIIKSLSTVNFSHPYSLLILAKYQTLLAFTYLKIDWNSPRMRIYQFQLFKTICK